MELGNTKILAWFYLSGGVEMIFVILLLPFLLIAIFGGCLGVVYWVVRDARKRESDYKMIKEASPKLSLLGILLSLIVAVITVVVKYLDNGIFVNRLYFLSTIIAALTVFLGILALPRWQSFAALVNFFFVCISLMFFLS